MPFEETTGLAWREDGAPHGRPVVFHHGWPSSRVLGRVWTKTATRLGWRVISVDRPGIGGSLPRPGRTLAEWPEQLATLLDRLGVAACPVIGMSGGGPYTLACVAERPERFTAAAVISGAPPLDTAEARRRIMPAMRALIALNHAAPALVTAGFRMVRRLIPLGDRALVRRLALASTHGPDHLFLGTPLADATLDSGLAAWRGARDGVADEARLYLAPWPFAPERIPRPVGFWHGEMDPLFPPALARGLAAQIPGAAWHVWPGSGHFGPLHESQEPVLAWLDSVS